MLTGFWLENEDEKGNLEDLGVDGSITLRVILNK
jgi:hypothetical protein